VPSRGPLCYGILATSTKPVTTSATTATRAGCVRRGLGTPFSRRGSVPAAEGDRRPSILQLNTERPTNKIRVIQQIAYKNKAFIFVLQETQCTTADKLLILNFSQAGSVLSRKHSLATFVRERPEWSLVDQSPEQSETEWLCVGVAGYKIIYVYTPPRSRLTSRAIPSLYVGDFNCHHVNWGYNKTSPDGEIMNSWATANKFWLLNDLKGAASFSSHRHTLVSPQTWPCDWWPGQPTAGQTCSRKVPAVTTPTLLHNTTETQTSCLQRYGDALELS